MTGFGMAVLFAKYWRETGRPATVRRVYRLMSDMQREEPGEWLRFLAWAAIEKEKRNDRR